MKCRILKLLPLILFLLLPLTSDLRAVSLSPELIEKLRKEGRLEEVVRQANLAREKGVWQPSANPPLRAAKGGFAGVDTLKPIVICVDFDSNVHTYSAGRFDTLLFSKDFVHPTGSMRDYYLENSYGKLDLLGGVAGWYRMPEDYSYYVGVKWGTGYYPYNSQKLAEDAIDAADADVNFAEYDHDGDLWVDGLIIVHAGPGAEETGLDQHIWSHKWQMPNVVWKDGVKLYEYNIDPETYKTGFVNMGVFSHEFGHTLGLPDLYDEGYDSEGLGDWTVMAHGSWNHDGASPAHFDAWCKKFLGFSDVQKLTTNQTDVQIVQAETSPVSYRLPISDTDTLEYFLVENRQKTGFDSYLPGEGLLIYHVDENWSNNFQWCPGDPPAPHYKVALEQADGFFQLEGCYGSSNQGNTGDPFPGSYDKRALDDTTTPSTRDYYDNSTRVAVWNISDSDSAMSANMDVTWSRPCLLLNQFVLDDTTYGNGNGLPEPEEKIKLYFTISNIWLPLSGTTVTGSVDEAGISFSDSQSSLGYIATGTSVSSYSDPMEFDISPSFTNAIVTFTLHVEGNGGSYSLDMQQEEWMGRPDILIVDDDSGTGKYNNYEGYYTDALDSLQRLYDVWDKTNQGDTTYHFSDYEILIWYTGDHREEVFSQADVESLMSFLDNGGKLFLTSQDAAEALSGSGDPLDSIFLTDYLHCSLDNGSVAERQVLGVDGDGVGDGFYMYPWGVPSPQNQISRDALAPDGFADTVLNYAGSGWIRTDLVAGLKYEGDYKLVFFGFGFEGLNTAEEFNGQPLDRPHFVMQRVLDWLQGHTDVPDFEEEHASIPKSIELLQNYPNPFNPNTGIQFTVNSGRFSLRTTLRIYNIRGQLVRTLVDEEKVGGDYVVLWDGRDEKGKEVSSGIYFYRLSAGSSSEVKKMVLLK